MPTPVPPGAVRASAGTHKGVDWAAQLNERLHEIRRDRARMEGRLAAFEREERIGADRAAMVALGQRERRAAKMWLRGHVDEVRVDLGLPTRADEQRIWLRAVMAKFSAEMAKANTIFQPKSGES